MTTNHQSLILTNMAGRFGGGFELMRDGGDKEGIWTLLETGMR